MKYFAYNLKSSILLSLFVFFSLNSSLIRESFFELLSFFGPSKSELGEVLSKKLVDKEYYRKEVLKTENLLLNKQSKIEKEVQKEINHNAFIQEKELSILKLRDSYKELGQKLGPLHPEMQKIEDDIAQVLRELEEISVEEREAGSLTKIYFEEKLTQAKLLQNLDYYKEKLRVSSEEVLELDKKLVSLQGVS